MNLQQLLEEASALFARHGVSHCVFGAVALNFWAGPRATNDLDVLVDVPKDRVGPLADALIARGFKIVSTQKRLLAEGRIVRLPIGTTGLDLKRCTTSHEMEALRRAAAFTRDKVNLRVATAEDIVLFKLQPWRRQDQADIERIVREVRDLDRGYIARWVAHLQSATGLPLAERWREFLGE